MAQITETGVGTRSVEAYRQELQDLLTQAFNLPELDFAVETPQGQMVNPLAMLFARVDQELADIYAAGALSSAVGVQLDALMELFRVFRRPASASTATVQFTGSAGATIPVGTTIRSTEGDLFATDAVGTIVGTTADVAVQAIETGPVAVLANTLNELVTALPGITAVNNPAAGVTGRNIETDAQLRNRFILTGAKNSLGNIDSIRGQVLSVPGVTHCVVRDNPSATEITVGTTTIPAYSVLTVVEGGTNEAVALAILRKKPAGTPTTGAITETVQSISEVRENIQFTRVTQVPLVCALRLDTEPSYAGETSPLIIETLVEYVGLLDPGETLDVQRARAAVLQFAGFSITSLDFTVKAGGGALPTTVDITNRLTLAEGDVNLTI